MPNNNPQQTSQGSQRSTEGSSKISDRVEKTADKLGDTAERTASAAIQRVRDVRERAESGLEQQRAMVADRIRRIGGVLRAGSETLSTDDPFAQNLLTTAGDRVESIAQYIADARPSDLANDVTSFARRRPGVFFGSAFLIGLALGRFAKSTTRAVVQGGGDVDDNQYGERYEGTTEADYSSYATQQTARERPYATSTPASSTAFGTTSASGAQGATLPYSGTQTTGSLSGSTSSSPSGTAYGSSSSSTPSTASTPSTSAQGSASGSSSQVLGGSSTTGSSTPSTSTSSASKPSASTSSTSTTGASTSGASTSSTSTPSTSTPKAQTAGKTPSSAPAASTSGTSGASAASTTPKETERGQGTKS